MICYLVDWGNGFVGGYTNNFDLQFNTPKQSVFDDMKQYGIKDLKIITPQELDELRGFHKTTSSQYFSGM